MNLGEKIDNLLRQNHMTKIELALKMGLKDSSVVSHWVKNRFRPGRTNVVKLAGIFDKPVSYFEEGDIETVTASEENRRVLDAAEKRILDVLHAVEAEEKSGRLRPIHVGVNGLLAGDRFRYFADAMPEEYLPILVESYGDRRVTALRIYGDSMRPFAEQGDYLIIAQAADVPDGRLALLRLVDGTCTLRRVFHSRNMAELVHVSKSIKPMKLPAGGFTYEGQVVGVFRKPLTGI